MFQLLLYCYQTGVLYINPWEHWEWLKNIEHCSVLIAKRLIGIFISSVNEFQILDLALVLDGREVLLGGLDQFPFTVLHSTAAL